jgi:hypothetical protein
MEMTETQFQNPLYSAQHLHLLIQQRNRQSVKNSAPTGRVRTISGRGSLSIAGSIRTTAVLLSYTHPQDKYGVETNADDKSRVRLLGFLLLLLDEKEQHRCFGSTTTLLVGLQYQYVVW